MCSYNITVIVPPTLMLAKTGPKQKPLLGGGGTAISGLYGYVPLLKVERYGFQTVYSRIRYINQSVWV